MNKFIRNSLSVIILLVLFGCNWPPRSTILPDPNSVLRLTVQTQNNVTTFSQAGEKINLQYIVKNIGTPPLGGPVTVVDPPRQPACPALTTVINLDNYLDKDESVTCLAVYDVTQSDVTTGSIVINAYATAGTITSNQATFTLTLGSTPQPSSALKLEKSASTQTYGAANQSITYTFRVINTGTTNLGPAQFTVTDNKLGAPFACGEATTALTPGQSFTCSAAPYLTTAADMAAANITNTATVSAAGLTSAPATLVIANLLFASPTPTTSTTVPPASNLTPGTTIQHRVAVGEWLIQIARCYGANPTEVIAANRHIPDPSFIRPEVDVVTVPRIGSVGRIFKQPNQDCVTFHLVQSGDTWASLAQRYSADLVVLQKANPGGLVVGKQAKIPWYSAGTGVVVTPQPGVTFTPTGTGIAPVAMRITFDPGATTASRIGVINPGERIQYIVTAAASQVLTISLTAPANEVSLGVNNPNGLALKTPDSLYTWSSAVATAGDHTINLASLAGNTPKSYTLTVTLTNAATLTPTATATQTPITPAQ